MLKSQWKFLKMNDKQRNLLLEYAKLDGENIEKLGEKGIFDKIKNAFT